MQMRVAPTKKGSKVSGGGGSVTATSRRGGVSTPPSTTLSSAASVSTSSSLNTNVQDKSWNLDVTSTGIASYKVATHHKHHHNN